MFVSRAVLSSGGTHSKEGMYAIILQQIWFLYICAHSNRETSHILRPKNGTWEGCWLVKLSLMSLSYLTVCWFWCSSWQGTGAVFKPQLECFFFPLPTWFSPCLDIFMYEVYVHNSILSCQILYSSDQFQFGLTCCQATLDNYYKHCRLYTFAKSKSCSLRPHWTNSSIATAWS